MFKHCRVMPSPLRESPGIILKLEWEPCENNTNVLESQHCTFSLVSDCVTAIALVCPSVSALVNCCICVGHE